MDLDFPHGKGNPESHSNLLQRGFYPAPAASQAQEDPVSRLAAYVLRGPGPSGSSDFSGDLRKVGKVRTIVFKTARPYGHFMYPTLPFSDESSSGLEFWPGLGGSVVRVIGKVISKPQQVPVERLRDPAIAARLFVPRQGAIQKFTARTAGRSLAENRPPLGLQYWLRLSTMSSCLPLGNRTTSS